MYVMRMHMSYLLIFPCSFFNDPSYSIYNVFNYATLNVNVEISALILAETHQHRAI